MITKQTHNTIDITTCGTTTGSITESVVGSFDIEGWTSAPLRLQQAIRLAAPQAEVFALIADHKRITEWFPLVEQVDVCNQHADTAGGVGAIRYCMLTNGVVSAETILACDTPQLFSYAIHEDNIFGLHNHLAVISLVNLGINNYTDSSSRDQLDPLAIYLPKDLRQITPEIANSHAADDHTILTWQHYFNHTNPGAMVAKLDANLRVGLQNLIDHFGGEWLDSAA